MRREIGRKESRIKENEIHIEELENEKINIRSTFEQKLKLAQEGKDVDNAEIKIIEKLNKHAQTDIG